MEPTQQQAQQLKQVQLELLTAFISVCERLSLRYYIIAGTLIGAVRHKGFIPWDDDIDVAMPRPDYEIFLQEAQPLLPPHVFVQHIGTEPQHANSYAKLRNSNTAFMETANRKLSINQGVYIDVFVLDYYPDNAKKQRSLERKKMFYNARINRVFYSAQKANWKGKLIEFLSCLLHPSFSRAMRGRDKMYRRVPRSSLYINHGGAWGKREIQSADWYGDGVMGTFEGIPVRLPTEYDKILTHVYGDYMQLPPVEKRVSHHGTDVIDLEKSYLVYEERRK